LVITEQPSISISEEELKKQFAIGKKISVPQKLKMLLGKEFVLSVNEGRGLYYWTHFIKCPGNVRDVSRKTEIDRCANEFLIKEISTLKPSLILCFGSTSSRWLLKRANKESDWRDHILDELCEKKAVELEIRTGEGENTEVVKTRVIFLFHPAERSGIGWFIDKRLGNLIHKEIATIKKSFNL
jgi:uracil-DNA glycosylase family 4